MRITTRGLERFAKKVSLYKDGFECDEIAQKVAERGAEIIREKYGARHLRGIDISKEGKGQRKITVRISFDEYGTGNVGQGTYEGELPTEPIRFESPKGYPQETQGWEYSYYNPLTKIIGGHIGWYFGGRYTEGQPAQAQMFHSAQQLRSEIINIALSVIKGVKRK